MALPRNAARSGGPSTSRGGALASQNSLKTGIYSAQVILPGEDADEFEALLQDQMADFRPRNSLEQALVQDIAVLRWKKQRIESIEQRTLREAFEKLVDKLPLDAIFNGEPYPVELPAFMWEGLKLTAKQVANCREIIPQIEKWREKRSSGRYDTVVPPDSALFGFLNTKAMERGLTADVLLAEVRSRKSPLFAVLDDILVHLHVMAQSYLHIASKKTELGNALMSDWTTVMRSIFYGDRNRRALEDTSRALYRTLAELRKLQIGRQYVDVRDLEDVNVLKQD